MQWLDGMDEGDGRSPRGERGLKSIGRRRSPVQKESLPSRGAWIEMLSSLSHLQTTLSLPSRGAWIEIVIIDKFPDIMKVAPLAGSVD